MSVAAQVCLGRAFQPPLGGSVPVVVMSAGGFPRRGCSLGERASRPVPAFPPGPALITCALRFFTPGSTGTSADCGRPLRSASCFDITKKVLFPVAIPLLMSNRSERVASPFSGPGIVSGCLDHFLSLFRISRGIRPSSSGCSMVPPKVILPVCPCGGGVVPEPHDCG